MYVACETHTMNGLSLVTIVVADQDEAIAFYCGVLGCTLVENTPSLTNDGRAKRWIVIRPSGNRSDILLAAADGADQQAAVGNQTGGRVGFFLTVSNFDATLTRLVEWGAEIVGEPRDEPYGRIVVFVDIAGNRWDLLSSPPQSDLASRLGRSAQLTGEFVLRSGLTAHTYFDKYQFEADPRLLREVARAMVGLVPAGTEVLAGLELGGVPVVTALSLETGLPACFVRKTAKEYGTARLAEGADIEGRSVLVVEDIVTTGGKVVISTDDLRQRGAIIDTAVCVIDREQGGSDALTRAGISLKPLFTRTQAEQP